MNSLKRLILILPIFLLLLLVLPLKVEAAKKVEYIDTKVFAGSGNEYGWNVTHDSNDNIFMIGSFQGTVDFDFTGGIDNHTSNGSYDEFITKVNSDGTYGWTKTIGNIGYNRGIQSVKTDLSNNIYVTGYFSGTIDFNFTGGTDNHTSNGGDDIFLTKINADGTYGYTETIGGTDHEYASSLTIDSLSNIYFTGSFRGTVDFDFTGSTDNHTSNGSYDIFLTKINADETYGYTKTFGGTGTDFGGSLTIDTSKNILLFGNFVGIVDFDFTVGIDNHASNGSDDIFVTKINSDGSYGYTKTFGGIGYEWGTLITLDTSNNIYLTGSFENIVDFDFTGGLDNHTSNGSGDVFVVKINANGTYGWTKTFGGSDWDVSYSVVTDKLNNVHLGGYFYETIDFDPGIEDATKVNPGPGSWGFVNSFDSSGVFRYVKTFESSSSDIYGLTATTDKLYISGDYTNTGDFNPDGPSDIKITDSNGSAFLASFKLLSADLVITESGGTTSIVPNVSTDTITVKLDAEPDSNVTVSLGSSDGSLVYSPSSLTFTIANYNTPQTVTISSATPVGANTTKNMTFTLTSSDTDYNGLTVTPLIVGVNVDNSDVVAPGKVVITNLGNISNIPNKDILRYYFTSQTPTIKGTAEANSTVYFVVNGHTYSTITGSEGKYTITLSNPSLLREKNVIVYYAKDSYFNKSAERTLELTVGEENFPVRSSSSSSSSESSLTSSSSSSVSSSSTSSLSSSSLSSTSSIEVIETTKEITIKEENGILLSNTKVTINGKTYTTDSKGRVKAEVAGVYVIEYDKGGVKYASTIKSSESVATLKAQTTSNTTVYVLVFVVFVILLGILLLVKSRRRKAVIETVQ